jgi:hypothetical protein
MEAAMHEAPEAEEMFGPAVVDEGSFGPAVVDEGAEEESMPASPADGLRAVAKQPQVASGGVEVFIASAGVAATPRPSIEIGGIVEEGGTAFGEAALSLEAGALLSSPELDDEGESTALWSDVSSGYEWGGGSESEFSSDEERVSDRSGRAVAAPSTATTESVSTRAALSTQGEEEAAGMGCDASPEAGAPADAALLLAEEPNSMTASAAAGSVAEGQDLPAESLASAAHGAGDEQAAAGAAAGAVALTEEGDEAAATVAATMTAAALAAAAAAADAENGDGAVRNGFGIKVWRDSSR